MEDSNKVKRVLNILKRLENGEIINKVQEAGKYEVSEKTIERDIDDIRKYMASPDNNGCIGNFVIYDRTVKGYRLEKKGQQSFSDSEILAICKILLDSRAFTKTQMDSIIERLLDCCLNGGGLELTRDLIANEKYHYIELLHKKDFLDTLWQVGQAIKSQNYIEIIYTKLKNKEEVKRKLRPEAIMFSEYYFYIAAFIDDEKEKKEHGITDDKFPAIYRIDRIKKVSVLKEKFKVIYKNRFEEGEFRKRIQFMFSGKLKHIRFKCSEYSKEAILDRLPTARIEKKEDGKYIISAEVYGNGVDMWLKIQGDNVEML